MFSTNNIVLLSVVCFTKNSSTATSPEITEIADSPEPSWKSQIINPIMDEDVIDKWQKKRDVIFNTYDKDNDGAIFAADLQKLLFTEFNGFLTARHAEKYICLINFNTSTQLRFKQFDRMEPIITVLSKKKRSRKIEQVIGRRTMSRKTFLGKIGKKYKELFLNKTELLELLDLIGQNENFSIELFEEINQRLAASLNLYEMN